MYKFMGSYEGCREKDFTRNRINDVTRIVKEDVHYSFKCVSTWTQNWCQ